MSRIFTIVLAVLLPFAAFAQMPGQEIFDALGDVDQVTLTDADMQRLMATMRDLEAADFDDDEVNGDLSTAVEAISSNAEAMGILRANGYSSADTYMTHMLNAVSAMVAIEVDANRAEIEEGLAEIDALSGMMSPEQINSMRSAMMMMLEMADTVPAGNRALVEEYRDEFELLSE